MSQIGKVGRVWLWVCIFAGIFVLGMSGLYVLQAYRKQSEEEYRRFLSPNGKFQIIVYRIPSNLTMPGQSGDAKGVVRLFDDRGNPLQEKAVDMVGSIGEPEWTSTNVYIKLFADWKLR